MNEAEIRKYASLMKELDLTGMEIDEKQGVIRLEREKDASGRGSFLSSSQEAAEAPVQSQSVPAPQGENAVAGASVPGEYLDSVTSPTVGIFYAAPAENAEPYVKAGDTVHKGTVLCIIEAMKLMNEVLAEKDGVIEEVCVQNGQVVEYGTVLFRIREQSV